MFAELAEVVLLMEVPGVVLLLLRRFKADANSSFEVRDVHVARCDNIIPGL